MIHRFELNDAEMMVLYDCVAGQIAHCIIHTIDETPEALAHFEELVKLGQLLGMDL